MTFLTSVLISSVLAILSGLGIGGGSILMLWLTLVAHFDVLNARSINLLFFIPTAVISTAFRLRKTDFKIKQLIPSMISGCVCAVLFSSLTQSISLAMLEKAFGIILVITGLHELTYRARKAR